MSEVLARRDEAPSVEDVVALLRDRVDGGILDTSTEFRTFTVYVAPQHWAAVVRACRDEPALDFDLFDCLFGVDAKDEGFDVVTVLYSTSTGLRIALRTRCEGGRDEPVCESLTDIYRGSDWMERETWDMFGIEFTGHPGLAPRLLTAENFEGWPLRKDFQLASRVAKAWPGVKEPVELDDDGNVIERVTGIGDAPGPYDLDKAMAEQAKAANPTTDAASTDAADDASAERAEEADGADAGALEAGGDGDGDAAAAAKSKAEERRKAQAEARRQKAAKPATNDDADDDKDDA